MSDRDQIPEINVPGEVLPEVAHPIEVPEEVEPTKEEVEAEEVPAIEEVPAEDESAEGAE
jgi:hypothetical protein